MILTKDMRDVLEHLKNKILQEYDLDYEQTCSIIKLIKEVLKDGRI